MRVVQAVNSAAQVVVSTYRIIATVILGYYLIRETFRKERDGRVSADHGRGPRHE